MKLQNKLAFITGGGRGIGRAIAIAFAREEASIVVAARTRDQIESVANEIATQFGVSSLAVECDVANSASVTRAATSATAQPGAAAISPAAQLVLEQLASRLGQTGTS